ncbi:MAG: hypothetical protein K5894_00330 [Lachnospiraceae bacterium]|nr:hypothetical protein [Lachnospiraceae bacterium]
MDPITEGLKKIILAGIGAVAITADKTTEVVDELVKRGEITVEQGKALNNELKHSVKSAATAGKKDFEGFVGNLSKEDLEALKDEIRKAEEAEADVTDDLAGDDLDDDDNDL